MKIITNTLCIIHLFIFAYNIENSSNFAHHENYSVATDDWSLQYGGQREMIPRCQCTACYFAKPQVSHKKCVPIYNAGQNEDHSTYQPTSYSWTQLGG